MNDPLMRVFADQLGAMSNLLGEAFELIRSLEERIVALEDKQVPGVPPKLGMTFEPRTSYERNSPYAGNWGS